MKKIFIYTLCALALYTHAQDSTKTASDTSLKLILFNEVIFSVNKNPEKKSEVPYHVEVITAKQNAFNNPQTSADMLGNTGKVLIQKSQQGGGSPIIRGFEASRVLIVVDGVRMNNAIYRAGHLQDVITIDNAMLERTEVIFGPSSVMYGSDALGGTMHFYTRNPALKTGDKMNFGLQSYVRHSTANMEKTAHVDFNLGFKKFAYLSSYTVSDFGDLRSGNDYNPFYKGFGKTYNYATYLANGKDSMHVNKDPNIQKFSGYKQFDMLHKFYYQFNNKVNETVNVQYSTSTNIPRYDRLQEYSGANLKYALWDYGPQNRMLVSAKTNIKSGGKIFNNANIILAYQDIDQQRITRLFNSVNETNQLENVKVYSLNADFSKKVNEKQDIYYGAEATYNDVTSTATTTNIVSTIEKKSGTRYPDGGSSMSSMAVYATHNWEINEHFIFSDGIRFSSYALNADFKDTAVYKPGFTSMDQKNNAFNGNIGLVMNAGKGWRFNILGSTGYRAPNIDDIGKVFILAGSNLYVPNANLKPEYTINGDLGISKTFSDKVKIEATYFHTLFNNAIVTKDFKYNGTDSVVYAGTKRKTIAAQNVNSAYIQGVNASIAIDFDQHFSLQSSFNYTYGRYKADAKTITVNGKQNLKDTIVPLDHIAPIYGQTSLFFRHKKLNMEFFVRYNGWKNLRDYNPTPASEDNLSQATAQGMPAWYTLNIRSSYQITKYLMATLAVENLLDHHYRVFASGISAPGRNLVVSLRLKL